MGVSWGAQMQLSFGVLRVPQRSGSPSDFNPSLYLPTYTQNAEETAFFRLQLDSISSSNVGRRRGSGICFVRITPPDPRLASHKWLCTPAYPCQKPGWPGRQMRSSVPRDRLRAAVFDKGPISYPSDTALRHPPAAGTPRAPRQLRLAVPALCSRPAPPRSARPVHPPDRAS